MNIDLLFTGQGEAGLVSDAGFANAVAGVMYDARSGQLTLEFGDSDSIELNIPVEQEVGQSLMHSFEIQVGVIEKGMIAENRQVPLVLLHDPFGGGNPGQFPMKPRNSVMAFESFMRRCVSGQPVHRDELGDESNTGTILGGVSPAVLQFAPHLARQRNFESAPTFHHTPSAPGMGMGGKGGGNVMRRIKRGGSERTPAADDDE